VICFAASKARSRLMSLLIDTDAFCTLGVAGLLLDALAVLQVPVTDCVRLDPLPHMLRRGGLPQKYGRATCEALIPLAEQMPPLGVVDATWLDRFTRIESIDPGEAQLLAAVAEKGWMVLSNDKRALRAVKDVDGMPAALDGRICVLEAVLLALCERHGPEEIRARVTRIMAHDTMVRICFSSGGGDPRDGLRSYYTGLSAEVRPLNLWNPETAGTEAMRSATAGRETAGTETETTKAETTGADPEGTEPAGTT
jgi:hypothetical protein